MTRSSDREKQILDLFEAALDHPSDERVSWLEAQTDGDADLLSAVLAMLDIDERDDVSLRTGAAAAEAPLAPVKHPEQIGAYRVIRVIGEGGMGVVYEGERSKGDFEHRVAIKVIRPGLLSPKLVDRFQNERKILASLTHPGITKLFDGGELENGSPFIIMEYIDGVTITKWIDKNELSETDRLTLFTDVLDALGHAHQNLIVHRDITPSNVLVTTNGQPKLIDFGIAKPQADDKDYAPASESLISLSFTPGFAAPEREKGAATNILSDVFSLGRLLQAMMGKTRLKKDLRAIIDKACREKPEERYASVERFREDIEAYMTGYPVSANPQGAAGKFGYYIQRHPIGTGLAGLATASLLGGLVIMSSLYATAEAQRQKADQRFNELHALANTMMFDIYDEIDTIPGATAAKAELAETAQTYLDSLSSDESASPAVQLDTALGFKRLAAIQGSPSMSSFHSAEDALESLDSAETTLTRLLRDAPRNDDVRLALGQTYFEQAHIANNPFQDYEKARNLLAQSVSVLTAPEGGSTRPFDLEFAALTSRALDATVQGWQGEEDAAVENFRELTTSFETLMIEHPDNVDLKKNHGSVLRNHAEVLTRQNKFEEAETILQKAVIEAQALLATDPENTNFQRGLAIAYWRLAFALYNLGRHEDSLAMYNASMDINNAMVEADPENQNAISMAGTLRGEIILPLIGLGRYDEAEAVGMDSLAVQQAAYDAAPDVPRFQRNMLVQHYQFFELYTTSGDEEKACASLTELRRFTDMMIDAGTLGEGDLSGLRGLNPQFVECGMPEL